MNVTSRICGRNLFRTLSGRLYVPARSTEGSIYSALLWDGRFSPNAKSKLPAVLVPMLWRTVAPARETIRLGSSSRMQHSPLSSQLSHPGVNGIFEAERTRLFTQKNTMCRLQLPAKRSILATEISGTYHTKAVFSKIQRRHLL